MTRDRTQTVPALLTQDKDLLKHLVKDALQDILESEMTQVLQAKKSERNDARLGYRAGYYSRSLVTRVGKIELRVPQDRNGRFRTELFDRFQRSEKALVTSLMQMYLQGVSTRKTKAITEALCGHQFSASTISRLNKSLDQTLQKFANRELEEAYPYLILDARYERVREGGVVRKRAVLIAIGINWEGRRCILGVQLARKETQSSWGAFLVSLKERGLCGVHFVVSDDHLGLVSAITKTLPEAVWQRCYVHFLRNAREHLPRKANDDCLTELRWLYGRRNAKEAREDLQVWLQKWEGKSPKLCDWVEEHIEETFPFYCLPYEHHKHLRTTNLLERLNQEIKRRTKVIRIFPNEASCLRLILALCAEQHEEWEEGNRYLNMQVLAEHQKEARRGKAFVAA